MPITESRMTALLEALGDALDALDKLTSLIADAKQRVDQGAEAGGELTTLALMCNPAILLQHPVETKLALERERAIWTPARKRANARRRSRKQEPPASDPFLEGILNRNKGDFE